MSTANEARDWALLKDPVFHDERLDEIRQKLGFIIDMENVIYKVKETTSYHRPLSRLTNQFNSREMNYYQEPKNSLNSSRKTTRNTSF
jgi:hypothetical protein